MTARHPRPAIALAIVLAAFVPAASHPATAHAPDPVLGGALYAQDQELRFRWRAGQEPPKALRPAILAAADDSNTTRRSRAPRFSHDPAGTSWISYGTQVGCGPNGIACFSRVNAPTSFSMSFREQGHVFDWGRLRWCQAYREFPDGCFDVENIALDEFGHVAILHHHVNHDDGSDYGDAVVQAVSRAKPRPHWDTHAYGRCDTATLQVRYGTPTAASPISTCLALRTELSIAASATSLPWNGSVTFSARLSAADLDAYGRLGGAALAGRRVVLERRPPGGSAWTTVATMPAVDPPGTYRYTAVGQQSTMDWRTRLVPAPDDGIRGTTSAVVRVYVSTCRTHCPVRAEPRDVR